MSPGSLPLGVDPVAFREGRAGPHWRNQVLAWFFNRLGLAQAEGQGIQTMLRIMRQEGCPPPAFEASEVRVGCTLGANPLAVRLAGQHAGGQIIDRDAKRDALLRTIVAAGERGIRRVELAAVLPQASDNEIKVLLRDLRRLRKIHARGATAAARWYRGPERGQQ